MARLREMRPERFCLTHEQPAIFPVAQVIQSGAQCGLAGGRGNSVSAFRPIASAKVSRQASGELAAEIKAKAALPYGYKVQVGQSLEILGKSLGRSHAWGREGLQQGI